MKRRAQLLLAASIASPLLSLCGVANAETRLSFTTGLDYSTGDYGQPVDTTVIAAPLSMRVDHGRWSFRVSAPFLSIEGPADVADTAGEGGGDGADGGGAIMRTGTETGIGDTSVALTRSFTRIDGKNAYFDVTTRVRFPTGDERKGLGVGATDYTLNGELGTSWTTGGVYFSAGRRFLGDRAGLVDRQDGWQSSLGGWVRTSEKTRVGGYFSWRDSSFENGEDPSEIGAYLSYRMSDRLRLSLNGNAGLSEASPNFGAGLRVTWRPDLTSNR